MPIYIEDKQKLEEIARELETAKYIVEQILNFISVQGYISDCGLSFDVESAKGHLDLIILDLLKGE